jgi:hypothetical protein
MTVEKHIPGGMELLCNLKLRHTWFADAKELQATGRNDNTWHQTSPKPEPIWFDAQWEPEDLAAAADAVLIYGDACKRAEDLGNEVLGEELDNGVCMSMVSYLAMLWDLALQADEGGSQHRDHPEHRGEIDQHHLGLDTRTLRSWLDKDVDEEGTRLITACALWWSLMWDEIDDIRKKG